MAQIGTNLTFSKNSLLTVSPSELSAEHENLPAEERVTFCSTKLWLDLTIFVLLLLDLSGRPCRDFELINMSFFFKFFDI